IALIIGSSHGLAPQVKKACQMRLSISPMTFPHQLMRVLLAEQFYRAHKINANESYHK
ncbi:MAG: 23S rRNA (pseudouridine(1915)-N(3))-methyltransferase RlmH, partial [Clostridia bacterium]|nr:23S rRNA (pseudouridine(1915)-N(3))-methyltransferase RlmH [Clostridia bacterium]